MVIGETETQIPNHIANNHNVVVSLPAHVEVDDDDDAMVIPMPLHAVAAGNIAAVPMVVEPAAEPVPVPLAGVAMGAGAAVPAAKKARVLPSFLTKPR